MSLFRRKSKPAANIQNEVVAQQIAGHIIYRQRQLAGYLNGKAGHLSGKRLLIALILFCTVSGSYCLFLLISACN